MRELHTERLTLMPLSGGDAPFILELLNDPDWLQHIGNRDVSDLESARGYIRIGPQALYPQGLGLLKVEYQGEPVGLCGLLQRQYLSCPDIGYAFLPRGRGQGFATEAAQAVKDAYRAEHPGSALAGLVSPANRRSIKVLKALGMSFRKEFVAPAETRRTALYMCGALQEPVIAEEARSP